MTDITYLGHSAFLVETGGKRLIFDPFLSGNPLAADIDISTIKADYILITHGHGDHMADAETIAKACQATIISSYEVVTWFENRGVKGHPMNLGGKWKFDFGTVKYVSGVHSSMLPDGSYGGPSGGFVIWNDSDCFYHAGDTALTLDMKLIPITCPTLQFAILPVGDNFTMGYEDAVHAADYIQCDTVIGCHFDSFGFIKLDHKAAEEEFKNAGKKLILPTAGQKIQL